MRYRDWPWWQTMGGPSVSDRSWAFSGACIAMSRIMSAVAMAMLEHERWLARHNDWVRGR